VCRWCIVSLVKSWLSNSCSSLTEMLRRASSKRLAHVLFANKVSAAGFYFNAAQNILSRWFVLPVSCMGSKYMPVISSWDLEAYLYLKAVFCVPCLFFSLNFSASAHLSHDFTPSFLPYAYLHYKLHLGLGYNLQFVICLWVLVLTLSLTLS